MYRVVVLISYGEPKIYRVPDELYDRVISTYGSFQKMMDKASWSEDKEVYPLARRLNEEFLACDTIAIDDRVVDNDPQES